MEINKTVIVASRWFLFYLTYIDDARSNTNQAISMSTSFGGSTYVSALCTRIVYSYPLSLSVPFAVSSVARNMQSHLQDFLFVAYRVLLLIWLYNSFIEFWPSQPTLSIFFYLGQGSFSLVLLSSLYLF